MTTPILGNEITNWKRACLEGSVENNPSVMTFFATQLTENCHNFLDMTPSKWEIGSQNFERPCCPLFSTLPLNVGIDYLLTQCHRPAEWTLNCVLSIYPKSVTLVHRLLNFWITEATWAILHTTNICTHIQK